MKNSFHTLIRTVGNCVELLDSTQYTHSGLGLFSNYFAHLMASNVPFFFCKIPTFCVQGYYMHFLNIISSSISGALFFFSNSYIDGKMNQYITSSSSTIELYRFVYGKCTGCVCCMFARDVLSERCVVVIWDFQHLLCFLVIQVESKTYKYKRMKVKCNFCQRSNRACI